MFTGLIEKLGTVQQRRDHAEGMRMEIREPELAASVVLGESIAVNGACLTVVERSTDSFSFDVVPETMKRTNLGQVDLGTRVNLERALRVGDRLGGHFVQGHVDAVGSIDRREHLRDWQVFWFGCPQDLTRYMTSKGSIAIDGISLTLVEVHQDCFSVALIPHTLANTTLGFKPDGAAVNLETDLLAKYVWNCVGARTP